MKKILLTGSGGFIGQHLKKYLSEYELYTPRSFDLNLMDKSSLEQYLRKNKIDFIIHSASCGVRITENATIEDVAQPNIQMFDNLAKHKIPMITFGSGAEYDKSRNIINIKESHFGDFIPKDPYGYSKYLISQEIQKYDHILNLRIFGIYGQNENPTRVTTSIINNYINKEKIHKNK